MKIKRRKARILAVQALFQLDAQGDDFLDQLDGFLSEASQDTAVIGYAAHLARGAWAARTRLDDLIGQASLHWHLDRIAPVDRSILRMAAFELLSPDPPPAVVIDEAIELARKFSGQDSPKFVNGVLDEVRKRLAVSEGNE